MSLFPVGKTTTFPVLTSLRFPSLVLVIGFNVYLGELIRE